MPQLKAQLKFQKSQEFDSENNPSFGSAPENLEMPRLGFDVLSPCPQHEVAVRIPGAQAM